ncbi:MAG: Mbeg1-like protein [Bacilli bacterium]|jgi:hypothetical protein
MNMLGYINKYGDRTFDENPANIIDALVLTGVVYIPLISDGFSKSETCESLLSSFLSRKDINEICVFPKKDANFAKVVMKARRYKNVEVTCCLTIMDEEKQEQFAAASFLSQKTNCVYIAFRGTDLTWLGWKEDFNLSFMSETPAQKLAVSYIEQIALLYPDAKIYVGGHSKGGNLAMYGASFASREVQDRIVRVLNFDGPGFFQQIIDQEGYQRIRERIISIIPSYSIVGMMLERNDKFEVISSSGIGFMQHDIYTWQVVGTTFKYAKRLSKLSRRVHVAVMDTLNQMSIQERKELVDSLYSMVESTGTKTIRSASKNFIQFLRKIHSKYKTLSVDQKQLIVNLIKQLSRKMVAVKALSETDKK